tara:strand:- start:40 stop:285 length:246 start_codon:yes stop_codon:yes gene_type:complete
MTKVLTPSQKNELIEQYVQIVVDSMDFEDLVEWVTDNMIDYYQQSSNVDLKTEIDFRDNELYEELVDNVTNNQTITQGGQF